MKKILAFLICVAMLTLSLAGCGSQPSDDPVTLTLWHVYGEQADSPMNRLIEEFNATVGLEKGITVTVTNVTSTSKIGNQLLDSIAGNPGSMKTPDLFSAHTNTAATIGSENLVDWKEYFSEKELSNFVPEFIEDGTIDGKLTVFPVSKSTYALYINGSQFDRFCAETGMTYDMLDSWEGFFTVAQAYHQWSGGKPFCAMDYLIRHVELDVLAKGDELAYTESGWYDPASQSFKDSWMMFAEAMVQGHIIVSDLYANTQVMTGETVSGIGSTAAVNYYNDVVTYPDNTSEPMDLRVLPLPKTGDGQQYMPMTGVGLSCYKTTDEKAEAAAEFIRWFTDGERNLSFVVETGYMPVHNDAYAAIESYEFPNAGYESLYNAIRTMRENYKAVVRPDFAGYYDKVDTLYAWLRENASVLSDRFAKGETVDALAEETWNFFLTIG